MMAIVHFFVGPDAVMCEPMRLGACAGVSREVATRSPKWPCLNVPVRKCNVARAALAQVSPGKGAEAAPKIA
jgi:hypothetical protein